MPKQTAIMAKKSLQFTPLGPFMSMSGTIFIDRGNNAKAIRSIDVAGKHMLSTKTSLWMFPEGTRFLSKEPDMLPLKKGGFHLALNAGIPIIPIVVENYWHLYRQGVFESGIIKVRGKKVWLTWTKQLINAKLQYSVLYQQLI
jgi:lysophosphatidate acyltransferase